MTKKEQIEREAQSYWDCNPKYAFKEGVKWALTHPIGDLDEDFVWAVYNFVNKWKSGELGEIPLQKALATKFNDYFQSVLDESKRV